MLRWFLLISVVLQSTLTPCGASATERAGCLAEVLRERPVPSLITLPSVKYDAIIERKDLRGPRQRINRIGKLPWYSSYSGMPNARQADPRAFVFALGDSEAAKFFGFELHPDGKRAIVPSAQRLNWALDQIEKASLEDGGIPIQFRIRIKKVKGYQSDRDFVADFVRFGMQPLAEGTDAGLHDLAYHIPSVLMPENEAKQAIRISSGVLGFVEYLEKRNPSAFKLPEFKKAIEGLLEIEGNKIDTGTGNFGYALAHDYPDELVNSGVRSLLRNGMSPESWLQAQVGRHFPTDISVQLLVRDYVRERTAADPSFVRPYRIDAADLHARLEERRERIIEIAHRLQVSNRD